MDDVKLTGALPNMTVEITHGTAADGNSEHLTIHLVATPDFQAALPLLGGLAQLPFMLGSVQSPFALWTQAVMAPWALLAQSNPWLNSSQDNPWAALLGADNLCKPKK